MKSNLIVNILSMPLTIFFTSEAIPSRKPVRGLYVGVVSMMYGCDEVVMNRMSRKCVCGVRGALVLECVFQIFQWAPAFQR